MEFRIVLCRLFFRKRFLESLLLFDGRAGTLENRRGIYKERKRCVLARQDRPVI